MSATLQTEAPTKGSAEREHRLPAVLTTIALVLTAGGMLLLLAWQFLTDANHVAVTRDPAWYTWRTELLLGSKPSLLISRHGPLSIFSGGYRGDHPRHRRAAQPDGEPSPLHVHRAAPRRACPR